MWLISIFYFFVFLTSFAKTEEITPNISIFCDSNCEPVDVDEKTIIKVRCPSCDKGEIQKGKFYFNDSNIPCLKEVSPCKIFLDQRNGYYTIVTDLLPVNSTVTAIFHDTISLNNYSLPLRTIPCRLKQDCAENCNYFYGKKIILNIKIIDKACKNRSITWTLSKYKDIVGIASIEEISKTKEIAGIGPTVEISEKQFKPMDDIKLISFIDNEKAKETTFKITGKCKLKWPILNQTYNAKLVCDDYPDKTPVTVYASYTGNTAEKKMVYTGTLARSNLVFEKNTKILAWVTIYGYDTDFGEIYIGDNATVSKPPEKDVEEKKPEEKEVIEENLSNHSISVETLLEQKKFNEVYNHSYNLLNELKDIKNKDENTTLLRHLAADLVAIAPYIKPKDMINLISKALPNTPKVDPMTFNLLAESVLKVTQRLFSNNISEDINIVHSIVNVTSDIKKNLDRVILPNISRVPENTDYLAYDDMEFENVAVTQQMRESTLSILKIVTALGGKTGLQLNAKNNILKSEAFVTKTQKLEKGREVIAKIENTSSEVAISQDLARELAIYDDIYLQLVLFDKNPFWWDKTAKDIGTDVLMVNLIADDIYITNITADIDMYLHVNKSKEAIIHDKISINESNWRVYQFETEGNSKIIASFRAINEEFHVLVTTYYPNYEEIREKGKLILVSVLKEWHIETTLPLIYVAVQRRRGTSIEFEISVISIQCISWEMSNWDWTTKGCTFGNNSNLNLTHCICNHLSIFGGSFLVPPNQIQFFKGITFKSALKESRIVLSTILIFILVYVCALSWATHRDKILDQRSICLFPDTIPGDKHKYLIGILTGLFKGSATTAHISIQLFGSESNSRRHIIPFNSFHGDEDWYVMATPRPLGHIYAVRVFHDSYGSSPDWFCERIIVRDLSKRKQYTFIAQSWLSLLKSDGQVDRTFKLSEGNNLRKGAVLFSMHARTELRDNHLLLSVFTRPPDSTFTCKERITLAFTVLFLSLTTSAMFYGTKGMDPQGSFFITLREVAIIIESLLITVPLGITLTFLFRKSRPS